MKITDVNLNPKLEVDVSFNVYEHTLTIVDCSLNLVPTTI